MFSVAWNRLCYFRTRVWFPSPRTTTCVKVQSFNQHFYHRKQENQNSRETFVDEENKKLERAIALEEMLPTEGRGTKTQGMLVQNPEWFRHYCVSSDHFGTSERPRKVPTMGDSRFVGCTGHSAPKDHSIWWLHVTKETNVKCPLCGQVFQLVKIDTES
ncbi:hypothetical protein Gasu2_63230 [Galdieria sulphuraria]|uniref:Cytochrome c oxidase (Complex IV) subunit Vb n=1 Tax=Galdieria sulphuraria TaxID=130081 RepID=M2XXU3_GALSU|nr:cytochrome c oxidase (Complex IV) subunit Vb [Galdieria sulphuraria]EME28438.1 cytochrome c oxidase (Complex IV) subunit Vb [Galdieria sulphuraria]GJD12218.1 hypothetical protein Gasu2_63230 [Galdieria sulphuraria]|eukprot:XP_005704958.1 cytochrome c oxidase (Complex IV) subunit Vb [Galdieria sulphuraria]